MAKSKKASIDKAFRDQRMTVLMALVSLENAERHQDVTGQTLKTGPCPSQEELAAFSDGLLQGERRSAVVTHLDRCETCYRVMLKVAAFLEP